MNSSRPSESPHRITRCRTIGLLVAAALFTPSPSRAQGTAGGFTPAAVDVGPLGSAVVDIPIAVPPGRNGHQPQLSLRYDSRNAANGPLGLGFTLSGQSRIHVCSKQAPFYEDTVSREGFVNQRLCLDGQPLVSDAGTTHSGPAYWTSTRYRTLEESGVRVERKGGSVSCWFSPDCFFHAHRPDGSIAQYGHPVSERFSVRGSTSRKDAWLLRSVQDRNGNMVLYDYVMPGQDNQSYIKTITYSGQLEVRFTYAERTEALDIVSASYPDFERRLRFRLVRIDVSVRGEIFKSYHLSYEHLDRSTGLSGPSQLTQVQECDGVDQDECLEPVVLRWRSRSVNDGPTLSATPRFSSHRLDPISSGLIPSLVFGDFGGRGRTAVLLPTVRDFGKSGDGYWRDLRETWEDDDFNLRLLRDTTNLYQTIHAEPTTRIIPGDFDGDGRTDVLTQKDPAESNPVSIHLSRNRRYTGNGFHADTAYASSAVHDLRHANFSASRSLLIPADVNGDGLTDLLRQIQPPLDDDYSGNFAVLINDGRGGFDAVLPGKNEKDDQYQDHLRFGRGYRIIPMDHNGDGMTDFIAINVENRTAPGDRYLRVFISKGDGTFILAIPSGREGFAGEDMTLTPGDFNGDGKTDLLRQRGNVPDDEVFNVYLARGDGSFREVRLGKSYQGSAFGLTALLHPGDFNGDGKTDFAYQQSGGPAEDTNGSFFIFYSLGDGQFRRVEMDDASYQDYMRHTYGPDRDPGVDLHVADFNGDGQDDIMTQSRGDEGRLRLIELQSEKYPNHLLREVQTGDGRVRRFSYFSQALGGKNQRDLTAYVHAEVPGSANAASGGRLRALSGGLWLVDELREYAADAPSKGCADVHCKTFQYEGLVVGREGIGLVGFQKIRTTDHNQKTLREQVMHVDPKFRGRLVSDTLKTLSGETLTRRDYEWSSWAASSAFDTYFVRMTQRVDTSYEGGAKAIEVARDFAYDAHGNEIWELRTEGSTSRMATCRAYDLSDGDNHRGRALELTQAEAGSCTLNASARSCSCSNSALLSRKAFVYDAKGNAVEERDYDDENGVWEVTSLTYDVFGNVLSKTDPAGVLTTYAYDSESQTLPAQMVVDPAGEALVTTYAFDPRFGVKVLERGPNGAALIDVLDGFGRTLSRHLEPVGDRADDRWDCLKNSGGSGCGPVPHRELVETYQYETNRVEHRKYHSGDLIAHTRTHFDVFGREERQEVIASGGEVLTRTYAYDSEGRVLRESEPYAPGETAVFSEYVYDERGRPTSHVAFNGAESSFSYAIRPLLCGANEIRVMALVTSEESEEGVTRRSAECRDFRGQVTKRLSGSASGTSGVGPEQNFVYDALGRLIQTYSGATSSPGDSLETRYVYDSVGRRVQVINDARGQQDLRYAQGRLDRRTQGSETWTYEYDSAGRHTAAVLPDGTRREIAYDSAAPFGEGQVARMQMVRPGGAVESARTYSYDALGHLLGETLEVSGRTFAMGYSHRNDGELEQVTYPDGSQLSIRHDQAGNMTALDVEETENGQTFSTRYVGLSGYSALGQPGQLEFSNGVTTRYDYDGVGRLARVRTSSQSGDFVDKEYTWNGFGEVAQIEDKLRASFTQTFSFNDVGYLTRAEGAYGVRTYQYDDHGNLTDKAGTQLTYQGDRLLSASNGDTFEYDIRGNRTAKQTAEGTLRYRYSRLDQLKEVVREVRGATCAEDPSVPCEDITQTVLDANVYDANGARIMKTDRNGAVSIYVSPLYEVTTFTNGTELHTRYLNGPAGRIVSITDEVAPSGAGTQTALGAPFLPRKTLQLALIALCLTLAIALAWSWLRAAGETSLSGRARGFVAAMLRTVGLIGEATETQWQVARGTEFMRRRRRLGAASPLVAVYMAFAVTGCQGPLGDPISKVRGGAHGVERLPGGMIVGSTSRALLPGENGDGYPVAGTHFFHPDHLGSSTYVTDAHGHKVAETVYAPYGEVFEPASTGVDVFRSKFSGKEWDAGAELYYFEARHYDAYVGRFIQADIMLLGSDGALASDLNRYAYAANNPVVYTDPSGREVITLVAIGIAALVGATVSVAAYAATNHDDLSWQGFLIAAAAGFVAGAFGGAGGAAAATIGTASVSATAAGVAVVVAYSAAGGFAGSIVQQGFTNLTEGEDFGNIDWAEAGITAGIDGATAGLVSVPSGRFAKLVSKRWSLEAQRWNESLETARKYYKELPSGVKRTADRHKTLFNGKAAFYKQMGAARSHTLQSVGFRYGVTASRTTTRLTAINHGDGLEPYFE